MSRKIKICKECSGIGSLTYNERYESITETCNECNGTGKIINFKYSFDFPENIVDDLDNFDTSIWELFRKIKTKS